MKRSMKMLIVAVLMSFVLVPAVRTEASEQNVERSFNSEVQNSDLSKAEISKAGIDKLGDGYTGGTVSGLKQTGATLNTVSLSWNPASGAVGYYIVDAYNHTLATTQGTSVTINLSQNTYQYAVGVFPCDASGNIGTESYQYDAIYVYTVPTKVTGLKVNGTFGTTTRLSVIWDDKACYGFEAICYNKKGKQVDKIDTSTYRSGTFYKTNTSNVYSVKVRPYVLMNGSQSQRLYGAVSNTLYAVPQPNITTKNSDVHSNYVNLKWKKVTGASKYVIYVSQSQNSGYKKVATVKSSKKSYKITRFKGKTINLKNKTHYIKIVTYAKFGKKTVKSQSKPQLRARVNVYWSY